MNHPENLVSVLLITYNSADHIFEALESIKNQTYQPLELIISDDCSTDNTIEVSEKWLTLNKNRFYRTEIIQIQKNTGLSGNLNRGVKQASGNWIKILAGDDYLYPNCIERFINEIIQNPAIKIIFSSLAPNGKPDEDPDYTDFVLLDKEQQYRELLKKSMLPSPGFLIHKEVFEKTNGFNENYSMLDDYPFMLSVSKAGYRFYHIKEALIFYRLHDKSISTDQRINHRYYNDIKKFFKTFYLKELRINKLYVHYMHYLFQYFLLILVSKNIIKNSRTYMSLLLWGSVLNWKLRLQKRIGKISL